MFDKLRSLISISSPSSVRTSSDGDDPTGLLGTDPTDIMGTDPTGLLDNDDWFDAREVHTSGSTADTGSAAPSSSAPVSPDIASPPADSPLNADFERGTFAVPHSTPFLQNLETRAQNGAHEIVETAYVLTGPAYAVPNLMFQLDRPDYYTSATESSLHSLTGKMALDVAKAYEGYEPPKMVAWIHTHPNGSTVPSTTDKRGAESVKRTFERALGTDDFEFFNGIHAFDNTWERESTVDERYSPEKGARTVSWTGTRFKHTLAMWDKTFKHSRPMEVLEG